MTVKRPLMIDGDGHVFEDIAAIVQRMPADAREVPIIAMQGPFPPLDNLHQALWQAPPQAFEDPGGITGWSEFLDSANFAAAVLYPTIGLSYGRITDKDLAIYTCRAYNDWLTDTYDHRDSRFNGLALIPMQDPDAAIEELHRAVTELGMVGAMLPPTGLPMLLGQEYYWKVFAAADTLGCALALHGGAHQNMGMDNQGIFAAAHALGHPFGLMLNFTDMLMNGVFERFENVRFGFMEGGLAWFLLCMERCSGSYGAFKPIDPRGNYLQLGKAEKVADRILGYIRSGRLFVGVEGDEPALSYAINSYGSDAFVFSSDYPHEVNKETIEDEIDELMELETITEADKAKVLAGNAQRFYGL
ncbi:MAG: amidohydrolase family protein [Gammaproteobacteria bacterium]